MTLFLLSFAVTAFAILGLGAGLLMGRGPIKGSCGGDSALKVCSMCQRKERQ